MQTQDVTFFVDQYKLYELAQQTGRKVDPAQTVKTLGQAVTLLGPIGERFAVVEENDREGIEAYHRANFQVHPMNGDRDETIHKVIEDVKHHLRYQRPKYMVAVTNDPIFHYLFEDSVKQNTELRVLVPGPKMPRVFEKAGYDARLLSAIIPEPRPTRYAVLVDYENIHIGLERNGISVSPKILMEAIKKKAASLGDTGNIVAYADWDLLSRGSRYNIQRELALMSGVEPRYQPNENGKNSADMAIADQIRTVVEKPSGAPDAVDVVVVVSGDRDFKPVVDTAKSRDKKVVILTVRGTLSAELREAADEVDYLDDLLKDPAATIRRSPKPSDTHARPTMQFMAFLKQRNFSFAYRDRLDDVLESEQLRQAVAAKVLTEQERKFRPNFQHPLIQVTNHLLDWVPWRITDAMNNRNFTYVDSNYLVNGMNRDRKLTSLGIGRDRGESEAWLELCATTGLIVKGTRPHPHRPGETINTWMLPSEGKDNDKGQKQPDIDQPKNPAGETKPGNTNITPDSPESSPASSTVSPRVLETHRRRLEILQEQKAMKGKSADPSLDIEIEDLEKTIKKLEQAR
jgi:hypothetical protein